MTTLAACDPARRRSTGIFGTDVDQKPVNPAADNDWLKAQGVTLRRLGPSREQAECATSNPLASDHAGERRRRSAGFGKGRVGKRVLLVSADPASHVGQVFGALIGNHITPIAAVPGLDAPGFATRAATEAPEIARVRDDRRGAGAGRRVTKGQKR